MTVSQQGDEIEDINMKLEKLGLGQRKLGLKLTKAVDEVMSMLKKVNSGALLNMIADFKINSLGSSPLLLPFYYSSTT